MKLTMPFFGKKQRETSTTISKKRTKKGSDKTGGSFGSTTSSSSSSDDCTSPRTVLPPVRSATTKGGNKSATPTKPTVTREDLEVALRRVVETEAEFAAVLAEAEAAGLSPEETLAAAELAEVDESELRDAFAVFDADGDGRISAEELRAVLASLGDEACSVEDCRRMIGGVDADGDGFVCFDEFSSMMMMMMPLQGAAA